MEDESFSSPEIYEVRYRRWMEKEEQWFVIKYFRMKGRGSKRFPEDQSAHSVTMVTGALKSNPEAAVWDIPPKHLFASAWAIVDLFLMIVFTIQDILRRELQMTNSRGFWWPIF
jgi:hypothetical protein